MGRLKRAWTLLIDPLVVPVGWAPRLFVVTGTACFLLVRTSWIELLIYLVLWGCYTYQCCLASAYYRGGQHVAEAIRDETLERVELQINAQLVALDDLAQLCGKYGIPPEEVVPIIERGYGIRITEGPRDE